VATKTDGPALGRATGPLMILAATAAMSFQDAFVKWISADLPLWQLFAFRSLIAVPVLLLLLRDDWRLRMREALRGWIFVRSLCLVFMYVFFYAAIPVLDLSMVAACYYTGPIFIVLMASVFLDDRIGWPEWAGVLAAFCGVLLIVRPAGDAFSPFMLVPLLSALLYATANVVTRRSARAVSPWTLTLSLNLAFVLVGAMGMTAAAVIARPDSYPFLTRAWTPMGGEVWAAVGFLAAVSIGIHLALARAYQAGPTAVVAGFDYAYLLFAALWGFVFFQAIPDGPTVAGTLLIGLAGLWSLRARRVRARPHRSS